MHIGVGTRLTSINMSMTWWLEQQAYDQVFVKLNSVNMTAFY